MRLKLVLMLSCLALLPVLPLQAAPGDPVKLTDVRVAMDDGVVLAADVYVPTVADGDGDGRYPCVVELTPYRKEDRAAEGASFLPREGIALVEVDARGTGGSNGQYDIVFSVREQADAARWVDWAATRATKDGKAPLPDGSNLLCEERVGMFGGSYSGIIQYLTASLPLGPGDEGWGRLPRGSRHLAAIAPQRAYGDLYRDIVYHGGQLIGSFGAIWSGGTSSYYYEPPTDVQSGAGQSAWRDHWTQNDVMLKPYIDHPYADAEFAADEGTLDSAETWRQRLYDDSSVLPRIRNLRVPTLHVAGWFDSFTRGQLQAFQQAHELEARGPDRGPNFLVIGPWNHTGTHLVTPDQGFRQHTLDWYRWWLEDIDAGGAAADWIANGFDGQGGRALWFEMRSGRVNQQSAADGAWRVSPSWPPDGLDVARLYLRAEKQLTTRAPGKDEGSASYAYTPLSGTGETLSRWDNAAGLPHQEWDQRQEDGKGLTYQTGPMPGDVRVAGPIALRMVAATTGVPGDPARAADWPGAAQAQPPYHDTDWVVKVSEVAPDGSARLVTGGWLRASHRAVDQARTQRLHGEPLVPFHPHTLGALEPPEPGEALEYLVEVWPTAKVFRKGYALRLDISSADTPGHINLAKPALNEVFHDARTYLALPVVR